MDQDAIRCKKLCADYQTENRMPRGPIEIKIPTQKNIYKLSSWLTDIFRLQ